jgi:hypothetical protein
LLEKSFNIAGWPTEPLGFLPRVHEFKTGTLEVDDRTKDCWADAILVDPTEKPATDVRVFVEARAAAMNGTRGLPGRHAATR